MKTFRIHYILLIIVILSIASVGMSAQNEEELQTTNAPKLHMLSHLDEGKVLLRWGPSDHTTWTEANKSGMLLQRATVPTTDEGFANYDYDPSFTTIIKPLSMDDSKWETLLDKDQYASAAWVSLYQEKPQVTGDLPRMIKTQDDVNQKSFFVGMLAADHSHQAAIAMGLGYIDDTAKDGEAYIYKISLVSDSTVFDRVFVEYSTNIAREEALAPRAESKEKAVLLSWSKDFDGGNFTSYQIERADTPNGTFKRLTETPFLRIKSNPDNEEESYAYFTDSLNVNYKPFYYRIIGINPFGIESLPSPVVKAMGIDLTPPIEVSNIEVREEGDGIKITWKKDYMEPDLKGYIIGRSDNSTGPFGPLHEGVLTRDKKEFLDINVNKRAPNFYTVTVIDTSGNTYQSLPKFSFIEDNPPPPTPTGLAGSIDENGIATLTWDALDDPMIIGYKVYSSNSPDHIFIMKQGELLTEPTFSEKVALKTLSEIIIYKIAAVDKGYGYSYLTEGLELSRPDIIPPSSGNIKDYKVMNGEVVLNWIPSASEDLVEQQLWRKDGDKEWKMITTLELSNQQYIDKDVKPNIDYIYALKAVDDAQLVSDFSPFVGVSISNSKQIDPIDNLVVVYNDKSNAIDVKWDYTDAKSYDFLIYRGNDESNMVTYGKSKNEVQFEDKRIKKGNDYVYGIRVVSSDGNESTIVKSNPINLK